MKPVWLSDDNITSVDGKLGHFRLLEPLEFKDHRGDKWVVPAGTISDLSSFPWFVRLFTVTSLLVKSPFLHDYLYQNQPIDPHTSTFITRKRADQLYRDGGVAEGLGKIWAKSFYSGLRLGGWLPWGNYRRNKKGI